MATKTEQQQAAAEVVRSYEQLITALTTMHRERPAPIDWRERALAAPPSTPIRERTAEAAARERLARFRPSLLARWLGRADTQRHQLESAIDDAVNADDQAFQTALQNYDAERQEYRESVQLAEQVLAGDTAAMLKALRELDPFSSVGTIGESLRISVPSATTVSITLDVHSQDVIPRDVPRLLKAGKLSTKPLAQREYFRLYQDHVCSAVLRVGTETLAALPVSSVTITAADQLLDSSTGHLADQPILSVELQRATLERLNLDSLDPSDSLRHFRHVMDFKPASGFQAITPLNPGNDDS